MTTSTGNLRTRLTWRLQALFLTSFWSVVGQLPPERAAVTGAFLARKLGPHLRQHRKIRRNLAVVCARSDPAEIEAVARSVWGNFGALLAEFPHLATICAPDGEGAWIEVENRTPTGNGRPKVFVPAHLGNWEIVTRLVVQMYPHFLVIYSPHPNPLVDRVVQARRRVPGCEFVPKSGGMQAAIAALRQGGNVGLLADLRADGGPSLPFFGRDAPASDTPARLAVGCGGDLVPVRVERLGHARFRVTFHPPVEPDDPGAPRRERALDMTRKLLGLFETWIREDPGQWLCIKRRW